MPESAPPPLVSVVVPSYNHERYIETCLKSILAQNYPSAELIVLDDGSTDSSVEKIKALQAQHSFYFEAQKNMGLANTLNKGVQLARGKYIAICASDDYWHPQKLELQMAAAHAHPEAALIYSQAVQVDDSGREYAQIGVPMSGHVFDRFLHVNPVPAPTAVFRKDAFIACGGFDPKCYIEDYLFWLKLARIYPVHGVDQVLAYYRITLNSISRNVLRMAEAEIQIMEMFSNEPAMRKSRPAWVSHSFSRLARNQKKKALELIRKYFEIGLFFEKKFWKGCVKLFLLGSQ